MTGTQMFFILTPLPTVNLVSFISLLSSKGAILRILYINDNVTRNWPTVGQFGNSIDLTVPSSDLDTIIRVPVNATKNLIMSIFHQTIIQTSKKFRLPFNS